MTSEKARSGQFMIIVKFLFVVVLFILSVDVHADGLNNILVGGIIASNAGDYITTRYGLSQGLREGNPLMAPLLRREPLGVGVKITGTVFEVWVLRKLAEKPKYRVFGIVWGVALIGLNSYFAVHNARAIHRFHR